MKMAKTKYDVLSPDRFSIDPSKTYNSPGAAKKALKKWVKRYEMQGYYSYNFEKIPLDKLPEYCEIIPLPRTKF